MYTEQVTHSTDLLRSLLDDPRAGNTQGSPGRGWQAGGLADLHKEVAHTPRSPDRTSQGGRAAVAF